MSKYLDPRFDLTFKAVFAEHPDLIISFLNALLPFKEGNYVSDVEYLPTELAPENPLKKNTIVDVRCKDKDGRQFIVEMQMYWTDEFKQRVLFNASKAYVKQAEKGMEYRSLQPVYSLNIVNDNAFEGDNFYHQFQLAEKGNPDRIIDGIQLVFVELKKFKPQNLGIQKMMRLWLRFLTEINENTKEVPDELLENPDISKAISIVERGSYTDAQLAAYDKYWDIIATELTLFNARYRAGHEDGRILGKEEGRVEGRAEGRAEGITEANLVTAKKMKSKGFSTEDIAEITGLPPEEIEKL